MLLDVFRDKAEARDWAPVEWEVEKNASFAAKMAAQVRRALLQLAPKARWTRRALRAAAVLKSFTLTFSPDGKLTAGLDVDALAGAADSGALSEDLSDLLVAVGDAAAEQGVGVVLLLDEIQFLKSADLEALIVALHKCARRSLPITLVGAGLPQIPRLAGEAKSYSERLFRFVTIGRLDPASDARDALALPARELGIEFEPAAVDLVVEHTQGYPFFLQEYGRIIWDEASASPVGLDDVAALLPLIEARLDESFFRVRAERTTELELRYLYAMARLGPDRIGRARSLAAWDARSSRQARSARG